MRQVVLGVFISLLFVTSANAYCRDPGRAPEAPPSYDKPRVPSCLRNVGYGEEPECDRYELDRFQRETDRYIEKLQEYAEDSRRYAQEAETYAQCEITEARAALDP